jgi:membrane protein YdbS with pleckstrin-like domain
MKCTSCGTETPEEAVFCPKCGERLNEEPSTQKDVARPSTPADRLRNRIGPNDADDDESDDELWEGGYSGKAMFGSWLSASVVTVIGVVAAFMLPWGWYNWLGLLLLIVVVWGGLACTLAYRKWSVYYQLTGQRFIHRTGILKRTTDRIEVIDIDDVTYQQGLVQRMVGVGTIRISSSDRTHPELVLLGIEDVQRVADMIDDVRRKERRRRGLHIESI